MQYRGTRRRNLYDSETAATSSCEVYAIAAVSRRLLYAPDVIHGGNVRRWDSWEWRSSRERDATRSILSNPSSALRPPLPRNPLKHSLLQHFLKRLCIRYASRSRYALHPRDLDAYIHLRASLTRRQVVGSLKQSSLSLFPPVSSEMRVARVAASSSARAHIGTSRPKPRRGTHGAMKTSTTSSRLT
jgi:hypothetical protein